MADKLSDRFVYSALIMDKKRIIGALFLGCILAFPGCRKESLPNDGEIRFSVGPMQTSTEKPATKFGTLEDALNTNGTIFIYGRRATSVSKSLVFDGTAITWDNDNGVWSYGDPKYWNWEAGVNYDFLAVYQPTGIIVSTDCDDTSEPMSLSVTYNAATSQYDLMFAGKRRSYNDDGRLSTVPLEFHHMLCAVELVATNLSPSTSVRLNGYHFVNIISRGTAKVTASYDSNGRPSFAWTDPTRTAASVGGTDTPWDFTETSSTHNYGYFDLMIPQDHGELGFSGYPSLSVEYKVLKDNVPIESIPVTQVLVPLKDIPVKASSNLISKWEAGTKYCYEISIDPNGGVQIQLIITPWDKVNAETPGLLLPPDLT